MVDVDVHLELLLSRQICVPNANSLVIRIHFSQIKAVVKNILAVLFRPKRIWHYPL